MREWSAGRRQAVKVRGGGQIPGSPEKIPGSGRKFPGSQLTGIFRNSLIGLTILERFGRLEWRIGRFPGYFPGSREFAR
jgi:hypothetical protein